MAWNMKNEMAMGSTIPGRQSRWTPKWDPRSGHISANQLAYLTQPSTARSTATAARTSHRVNGAWRPAATRGVATARAKAWVNTATPMSSQKQRGVWAPRVGYAWADHHTAPATSAVTAAGAATQARGTV